MVGFIFSARRIPEVSDACIERNEMGYNNHNSNAISLRYREERKCFFFMLYLFRIRRKLVYRNIMINTRKSLPTLILFSFFLIFFILITFFHYSRVVRGLHITFIKCHLTSLFNKKPLPKYPLFPVKRQSGLAPHG